jgi:putative oxidoreductase
MEMTMLRKIVNTNQDFTLTVLRLVLGVIFLAHGGQKVFGWFGGMTFGTTMNMFTQEMHIPAPLAFLAIMAEFAGGIGLILGFLGRIAAFGIICNMLVAIFMVHSKFGFFMNWFGNQQGEGYEYHLLAIALAFAILVKGCGALSIDRALSGPSRSMQAAA